MWFYERKDFNMSSNKIIAIIGTAALIGAVAGCGQNASQNIAVNADSVQDGYVTKLGEYKNLTSDIELTKVTDEDIQKEIDTLIEQQRYVTEVERAAKDGDYVTVQYVQTDDENAQPQTVSFKIGSQTFPDEFESAAKGLTKGESASVELQEGEDIHTFDITLISVSEYKEADDAFVVSLNMQDISTLEDLKADIRLYLENTAQNLYNQQVREDLLSQIYENTEFGAIPDELYTEYKEYYTSLLEDMASEYSAQYEEEVTLDDLVMPTMEAEHFVGTTEDFITYTSKSNLEQSLMLQQIYENENLTYEEDELYSNIASEWVNHTDQYATMLDFLKDHDIQWYKADIINAKALNFVMENSDTQYTSNTAVNETSEAVADTSEDAATDSSTGTNP